MESWFRNGHRLYDSIAYLALEEGGSDNRRMLLCHSKEDRLLPS